MYIVQLRKVIKPKCNFATKWVSCILAYSGPWKYTKRTKLMVFLILCCRAFNNCRISVNTFCPKYSFLNLKYFVVIWWFGFKRSRFSKKKERNSYWLFISAVLDKSYTKINISIWPSVICEIGIVTLFVRSRYFFPESLPEITGFFYRNG